MLSNNFLMLDQSNEKNIYTNIYKLKIKVN